MARGQLGEAAVITINGEPADIHSPIRANDIIKVIESTAGEKGRMKIGDLPESSESLTVFVNDKKVEVPRFASVNGVLQSNYYEIQDGDEIEILNYYTVGQIVEFMDVILDRHMNLYVNHVLADEKTPVYENFSVTWTLEEMRRADTENTDAVDEANAIDEVDATDETDAINDASISDETDEKAEREKATENNSEPEIDEKSIQVIVNHNPITLRGKDRYVYVDVFEAIDIDLSRPRGKGIVTTLNGRKAQYMEPIETGDVIEVYWKS